MIVLEGWLFYVGAIMCMAALILYERISHCHVDILTVNIG